MWAGPERHFPGDACTLHCLAPSFSLLPFLSPFPLPSSPIQLLWCLPWNPPPVSQGRGEPQPQDWEDSVQMSITYVNRFPGWERGPLLAAVPSSTDVSAFSEGEFKDLERCCWKHKQCTGHIIHPFASDCGHHDLHLHSVSHCDCDSRCKSYRPVSVAVIHHPIHHDYAADDLNEEEEEEESKPPIPTQVGPATTAPADTGMGAVAGTPDSAAPITIWRSESPTGKSQGNKVIKKVKKKKEKEKDKEEEMDEKAKPKKKVKKGKLIKKKSPVKSETSPPDLSLSVSPRELARMSESSPDSREDLESEDSYNDSRREEPSSEDIVESSSPRKGEKNTVQTKKPRAKASPVKVVKRKSPPASNPNLS
ncbi:protein PROCA1 isoform X5 [Ailuropoda melanoleuca]|uniref:protein PROCA1 isoform X5 n=1 Tax=Ailuropoda melanoleuca TaxID=9646 RepID=UPI0009479763|nr:protein PROCA1 isoform X5 [Ailuropoda melanoleuca]